MGINQIVLGLLAVVVLLHVAHAYSTNVIANPSNLPWVPIQVGKTRSFHSQTRDAGMYIEAVRRKAIIGNPTLTPSYRGSTNGSLEWNFLTGICVCPPRGGPICPPAPDVIWNAENADDEICDVVDAGGAFGGYEVIDFGGAEDGKVCDIE
jgi:hypothetical protein